jgi:hypothetical protein
MCFGLTGFVKDAHEDFDAASGVNSNIRTLG